MQTEQIAEALMSLNQSMPDIEGSMLIGSDGDAIASVIDPKLDPKRIAAISASLASLSRHCGHEADLGEFEQMMIKGTDGYVLLVPVTAVVVLGLMLKPGSKPGLVMLEARTSGDRIRGLL